MPTISKQELDKVKKKEGIYSSLSKSVKVSNVTKNKINELIIEIVERSFKQYAKAHGCKTSMLEIEWNRMKQFLLKNL